MFGIARAFVAWWLVLFAAALFVACTLIALQGLAAQFLAYPLFLRVSGFLQLGAFFAILGIFFLKPPFPTPGFDAWMPSFWFFGLFHWMIGESEFRPLAIRALQSLAISAGVAAATFSLAYGRSIRKIVEQPDIVPSSRTQSAGSLGPWLVRRFLPRPIDRAIVLFTARGIARSRQHRLLLAAFTGIGLAIALAYARTFFYADARSHERWYDLNMPFLVGSMVVLFFAAVGTRAVFAMPIALTANWVFRITVVHSPVAYFSAVRKALFALAALPVWLAAAVIFLTIWPAASAIQHVALMVVVGILVVEKSLRWFRKIPFACSYLPGKAQLHIRLGAYGALFLTLSYIGVGIEYWSLQRPTRFAALFIILLASALWARRQTIAVAAAPASLIEFEDLEKRDVAPLDLH